VGATGVLGVPLAEVLGRLLVAGVLVEEEPPPLPPQPATRAAYANVTANFAENRVIIAPSRFVKN
jgi:hypothetical protein